MRNARRLGSLVSTLPLVWATSASATTYQVGPGQTFKDLASVASKLAPGDVVELQGNATYAGGVRFTKSGTEANKITIRGVRVNGKRPVVSGGASAIEVNADHYVVEGVELTGADSRCFYHHGGDVTLRDSVVHDCPSHGILGADSDSGSLTLDYVEVYKTGSADRRHQIYIATDETAYPGSVFRMQHCYVHDANGGNNVKSRAERNEIYYNWIEGALYHEIELIGPDGQDDKLAREDSDVVGNVLRKTGNFWVARFGGDGTGDTNGRYRVVNNTIILGNSGTGVFRLFDGIESLEVHDNVVYGTGSFRFLTDSDASWATGKALISGQNNWVSSSATAVPSQLTGLLKGTDPGFASATQLDFMPTASSPLVDAGESKLSAPAGHEFPRPLAAPEYLPPPHALEAVGTAVRRAVDGTIDIGAYEYGTGGGAGGSSGAGGSTGAGGSAGAGGEEGKGGAGAGGGAGEGAAGSDGEGGGAGTGAGGDGAGGSEPGTGAGGDGAGGAEPGTGTGGGAGSGSGSVTEPGSDGGVGGAGGAAGAGHYAPSRGTDAAGCSVGRRGAGAGGAWLALAALAMLGGRAGTSRRRGRPSR